MTAELRKLGATRRRGRRLPRDHAARALARRGDRAPTTTTAWRCAMSLAAFNGSVGAATGKPVRIARPALRRQDLARLLRGAVRGRIDRARRRSRCSRSTARPRPARARSRAPSRAELGYVLLDSGAVYRATAIAALQAGVEADDETALATLAPAHGPALRSRPHLPRGRRRERPAAPRGRRRARLADLGVAARARRPARRCRRRFAACPAWSPTAATWERSSSPTRRSRCSSPPAPPNAPSAGYKQLISKGISANIDSLRADLEARDARDIQRRASPAEARRRCVPPGQLGAHDRSFGRGRARSLGRAPAFRPTAGLKAVPGAVASPPRASWHTGATDPLT